MRKGSPIPAIGPGAALPPPLPLPLPLPLPWDCAKVGAALVIHNAVAAISIIFKDLIFCSFERRLMSCDTNSSENAQNENSFKEIRKIYTFNKNTLHSLYRYTTSY